MKAKLLDILILLAFGSFVFFITQKFFLKTIVMPVDRVEKFSQIEPEKPDPLGNSQGINFVYIYNYRCEYCREMNSTIEAIFEKYKNRVSFYFLNTFDLHDEKLFELSLISECILNENPEYYFKINNHVYESALNNTLFRVDNIINNKLNIESNKEIMSCIELQESFTTIHANKKVVDYYGINQTPSLIIGDKLFKGTVDFNILDSILKEYLR